MGGTMSPAWMYVPGATLLECPGCHAMAFVGDAYVGAARCNRCNQLLASPWEVPFP